MSSSKKPPKKPAGARSQAPRAPTGANKGARGPGRTTAASSRAASSKARVSRAASSRARVRSSAPKPRVSPSGEPNNDKRTPPKAVAPQAAPQNAGQLPRTKVRFAGSGSSRLTIKPGTSQGPHTALVPSTKVRPSGIRRLSEVQLDEDEVLIDGFDAMLEGQKVRITAVLERTCVYLDSSGDRKLARKEDLLIEADKLPIRRRGIG